MAKPGDLQTPRRPPLEMALDWKAEICYRDGAETKSTSCAGIAEYALLLEAAVEHLRDEVEIAEGIRHAAVDSALQIGRSKRKELQHERDFLKRVETEVIEMDARLRGATVGVKHGLDATTLLGHTISKMEREIELLRSFKRGVIEASESVSSLEAANRNDNKENDNG